MSWWDTSGLTSFATNVVKSAQKKIDKVLDIDAEKSSSKDLPSKPSTSEKKSAENEGEFWNAWLGSTEETTKKTSGGESPKPVGSGVKKSASSSWKSWGFEDSDSALEAAGHDKSPIPASLDSKKSELVDSPASKRNLRAARQKSRRSRSEQESQEIPIKDDCSSCDILEPEVFSKDDKISTSMTLIAESSSSHETIHQPGAQVTSNPEIQIPSAQVTPNPEIQIPSSGAQVTLNPEIQIPSSGAQVTLNPEIQIPSSGAQVTLNPEIQIPSSGAQVTSNPEIQIPSSGAQVTSNPEIQIPSSGAQVTSNPEIQTPSLTKLDQDISDNSKVEHEEIVSASLIEFVSPDVNREKNFSTGFEDVDPVLSHHDIKRKSETEVSFDQGFESQELPNIGGNSHMTPSETCGLSEPNSVEIRVAEGETESLADFKGQVEVKDFVDSEVLEGSVHVDTADSCVLDSKVDAVDTQLVEAETSDTYVPEINVCDTTVLAENTEDAKNVYMIETSSSAEPLITFSDNTGSDINLEKSEYDEFSQANIIDTEPNLNITPSTFSSMEIVSESEINKIRDAKEYFSNEEIPRETEQVSLIEELSRTAEDYDPSYKEELETTCSLDASLSENTIVIPQEEDTDDVISKKDSLEEKDQVVSQSDEHEMTESSSSSVVKTMLEEAMEDNSKHEECDSHSHSSSDKSDFVKSEFSDKGHESGDEIDTTTSSDIEIISTPTPNGDRDRPFDLSPLKIALSRANRHTGSSHRRSDSQSSSSTNSKPEQMSPGRDLEFSDDAQEHTLLELGSHFHERSDETKCQRESQEPPDYKQHNPYQTDKLLKMHVCDSAISVDTLHGLLLPTIDEHLTSEPTSIQNKEWAQKMAEMAEVISARETKLVQLSKENNDLLEATSILRNQLKQSEDSHESEMADLTILTEEFTQRLGESERKLQAVLREKDSLKKQLEITQNEVIKKGDTSKFQKLIGEKDEQIQELLKEGEKLSKQQLQGSTIIKKLRSKEKETEQLLQSQKKKLETQGTELEHLKKVLDSKEEMEKKQSDALSQLNNAVQRQEKEIARLKGELDEHQEKLRGTQAALDTSYKEIAELHRANAAKDSRAHEVAVSSEMQAREELRLTMEREQQRYRQEKQALVMQIEDLRISLSRMEKEYGRREDMLRQEISDLQQRLQEDEARNQDLTHSVTSATRPLLRQIENLQSTYNAQSSSFETVEKNITERLSEVQMQLVLTVEKERVSSEKVIDLQSQVTALETQNIRYRQEKSQLNAQQEIFKTKIEMLEDSRNSDMAKVEAVKQSCSQEIGELKRQKLLLENQLEMEKTKVENEKKKMVLLQEELREKQERERPLSRNTPSPAQFSRQDSTASIQEPLAQLPAFTQEELLERSLMLAPHSPNGNKVSLYESLRQTGAANLLDNLISQLKQREGEIAQLQSEISELERTRESMARELVNLSTDNDELKDQIEELPELKIKHKELAERYNAILQMYGEKVEETEELKLDLQDVKELYKSQIDHLMKGH